MSKLTTSICVLLFIVLLIVVLHTNKDSYDAVHKALYPNATFVAPAEEVRLTGIVLTVLVGLFFAYYAMKKHTRLVHVLCTLVLLGSAAYLLAYGSLEVMRVEKSPNSSAEMADMSTPFPVAVLSLIVGTVVGVLGLLKVKGMASGKVVPM